MNIPKEIQKILDWLDKGMTIEEYAEFKRRDVTELKLEMAEKLPRKTYYEIRRVYFENNDNEPLVGNSAYKLQMFSSGRYGIFKDGEFKFMLELPEGMVFYDAIYSGKYKKILQRGGLSWVTRKVQDGWDISEIAEYCEVNVGLLKKFIKVNTGISSMNEFKARHRGSYLSHL